MIARLLRLPLRDSNPASVAWRDQVAARLAAVLLAFSPTAAFAAGWERVADLPEPNGGFAYALIDGEIVIAGGTNWPGDVKHWLDKIRAYDVARGTWREAGRLETPAAYAAFDAGAGVLWLAGGSGGAGGHPVLWRLGQGAAVTRVAAIEPRLVYASGALLGDTLYTVGGAADQARLDLLTNAFRAIDLRTGSSRKLADYPEVGFGIGTAVAGNDRIYVFGGARWEAKAGTVANLAAAHVYSPATGRWSDLPPLPVAIRGITAVQLDATHLLLAGGYRDEATGFAAETYLFDLAAGRYRPTIPLPYRAGSVGLVKVGEWLYALGGEDRMKHRTAAMVRIRWRELLDAAR